MTAGLAAAVLAACSGVTGIDPVVVDPAQLARDEVRTMADRASGAYQAPSRVERDALVRAARDASTGAASASAGAVGYRIERVQQADGSSPGADLVLLRPEQGVRARGWGWLAVRPRAAARVVVEVPHPRSDVDSELVAGSLFAVADAAALVVAGAHRRAAPGADVVSSRDSAFHAWHGALVQEGDVVVQVHGFDATGHPRLEADAVVSDGAVAVAGSRPSDASRRVADALERAGFRVCLNHRDACDGLAGTRNVQGAAARASGADFVHLELSRPLRSRPDQRAVVVDAVAAALTRW